MTIGCHGASHIPLRRVTSEVLDYETRGAKTRLEDTLGHRISEFAIPFGSYDRKVMKALDPFDKVYTSDHQMSAFDARIVMRHSYVKDWKRETPRTYIQNAPTGMKSAVMRARMAAKRLRP
ncbi:polysaccharide deacetylase family protein [Sedimentitalea sp. JM2-8]|uniref:Chitooligosaccharide deacetylase n=1 Tax=Sedimentitalea xiamensis TaxID=3050037 RepID=A0ABT7FJS6_9RHOB|nr:polysaccharide deacetylase family protein [Sedimentitalea xiamensis]MDK3075183.1 polysaccharide deacetylase family protein [Sedimentitalea xiamensis]